jgi:hypothetical protein
MGNHLTNRTKRVESLYFYSLGLPQLAKHYGIKQWTLSKGDWLLDRLSRSKAYYTSFSANKRLYKVSKQMNKLNPYE